MLLWVYKEKKKGNKGTISFLMPLIVSKLWRPMESEQFWIHFLTFIENWAFKMVTAAHWNYDLISWIQFPKKKFLFNKCENWAEWLHYVEAELLTCAWLEHLSLFFWVCSGAGGKQCVLRWWFSIYYSCFFFLVCGWVFRYSPANQEHSSCETWNMGLNINLQQ